MITGTSKQSFHAKLDRLLTKKEMYSQLEIVVRVVRKDHPGMNLRDLYRLIKPPGIGRDRFEKYFYQLGYGVGRRNSFHRTTDSTGVVRFENLILEIKLNSVNQVWVSDITYFRIGEKFYYLTFIMDLYSRLVVGFSVSKTLRTEETTMVALHMGLKVRKGIDLRGLILHSDGGGQYYSKEFTQVTEKHGLLNSMGKTATDNPYAERLNGIIKNNYIRHYNPVNFEQLKRMTRKAVNMYNKQKPHSSLGGLSPSEHERVLT